MFPEDLCWWHVNRNMLRGIQLKETTLWRAPCRCLESRFGKAAGLAEGTEIVGPIIMLVSWDLASYPHVLELAFAC